MGPADSGLEVWEEINPDELQSGTPVQRGHLYFNDEETGLMAGVWDCTPMTLKPGPYPVSEFMHVLEGSVTIVHEDGTEETMRAGDNFIIPKGTPCTWKQTEYIRKFFVIFDDASVAASNDPAQLRVIRPQPQGPDGGLTPAEAGDPAAFVGAVPDISEHTYFTDPSGQLIVGLWEASAMERPVGPINRCELMLPVEGEMTLLGDGEEFHFKTGDAVYVPVGAPYGWRSSGKVRKIYCIFMKKAAEAAEAAE
jgi:uncharacterized cupin superfamily protein